MVDIASRRGAVNLGVPLMVLAFLTMGGFMYWLYLQSEAQRQLEIQEAAEAAAAAAELERMGTLISGDAIATDASPFVGRNIRLEGLTVASALGTQGVWLELPNGNPFLVSFSEAVKAEGLSLATGQMPTVAGVVYAVNDSVLTAWTESGAIGEGDRLAAEFATHFLEAEVVRLADDPGGADGGDGGEGG